MIYTGQHTFFLGRRLALGSGLLLGGGVGDGGGGLGLVLAPHLRYYPVNRPRLRVYGEISTAFLVAEDFFLGGGLRIDAGVHLPVGQTVLLSPSLGFGNLIFGGGAPSLGFRTEFLLDRAGRAGRQSSVGDFGRGTLSFGVSDLHFRTEDGRAQYSLYPSVAYFLTPTTALGASLFYQVEAYSLLRISRYSLGPNLRQYLNRGRRWCWFVQLSAALQGINQDLEDAYFGDNIREEGLQYAAAAGGNFFLRRGLALEVAAGLSRSDFLDETVLGVTLGVRGFVNTRRN